MTNKSDKFRPDGEIVLIAGKTEPIGGMEDLDLIVKVRDQVIDSSRPLDLLVDDKLAPVDRLLALREVYGEEILRVLNLGKLRLSLLLNTPGGKNLAYMAVEVLSEIASYHGGQVNAWVTQEALSAGAVMFGFAHNRYALPNSRFVWHKGSCDPDAGISAEDDERMREKQLRENLEFFRQNANAAALPQIEARFLSAVADSKNVDCDVEFDGEELLEAGVVDKLYPTVSAMRTAFKRSIMDKELSCHPKVENFWLNSDDKLALDFLRKVFGGGMR